MVDGASNSSTRDHDNELNGVDILPVWGERLTQTDQSVSNTHETKSILGPNPVIQIQNRRNTYPKHGCLLTKSFRSQSLYVGEVGKCLILP